MNELLSPVTLGLLELFTTPGGVLRDVRFPDADGAHLAAAVDEARAASEAVVQAEAMLAAARETLAEKRRAVAEQTDRTLAYARIYAKSRPELGAALDVVAKAPRSAGRPRKTAVDLPRAKAVKARAETGAGSAAAE